MLNKLLVWLKAVFLWIFKKENRKIGIIATKIGLDLANKVADLTETDKDDKAIKYIADQFEKALAKHGYPDDKTIKKLAKEINKDEVELKDVTIGYSNGDVSISALGLEVGYSLEQEEARISKTFKI